VGVVQGRVRVVPVGVGVVQGRVRVVPVGVGVVPAGIGQARPEWAHGSGRPR
jgi:hypothetical protein